jgi:hypothetical protein
MRTRRSLVVTSAIAVFGALICASGALAGGGNSLNAKATVTITTSRVTGNDAFGDGGGIAVFGSLNLNSSTITGNTARGSGGGIFAATGAPVTPSGTNTVTGNTVFGASDNCDPDELLPGCISALK